MTQWQERFAQKVETLVDHAVRSFDVYVEESVISAFTDVVEFTKRFNFHASTPQHGRGVRSFKFALTEDAYVLVTFRTKGVAEIECEYECFITGQGGSDSLATQMPLAAVEREWADTCFQAALDYFIDRYAKVSVADEVGELATV